jgi:hypothetical protein
MLHAIIRCQPTDEYPLHAQAAQKIGKLDSPVAQTLEPRVAVLVRAHALSDNDSVGWEPQVWVKLRSPAPLHAVGGPDAPVGLEVAGFFRMPVAGSHNR